MEMFLVLRVLIQPRYCCRLHHLVRNITTILQRLSHSGRKELLGQGNTEYVSIIEYLDLTSYCSVHVPYVNSKLVNTIRQTPFLICKYRISIIK